MAVILTATNNVSAVSRGRYDANFTLNVRELDTRDKTLHLEAAQFELHFENVSETSNKLYVVTTTPAAVDDHTSNNNGKKETEERLAITTGTYSDADELVGVMNGTLKLANHDDIVFSYSRQTSRISVATPAHKRCVLKNDSPGVVLGVGEIATSLALSGSTTLPYAVDLTKGRRMVLLYTDLIGPSIEYEDNADSRVLKTFLIQTLNGMNNYVFGKEDKRLMLPHERITEMTFWLKFNTGEHITSGYPVYLDLRVQKIST